MAGENGKTSRQPISFVLLQTKTTSLHVAVSLPHLDISTALLKAGADVNAQNGMGKTPLHFVVANKNQQLLDLLLAHPKINLDFLDSEYASPLWIALLAESEDIADVLADKGILPCVTCVFLCELSTISPTLPLHRLQPVSGRPRRGQLFAPCY